MLYLCLHFDLLVEFFLHQFCHAHTCSGKRKLFPRGGKVRSQTLIAVDFSIKNELCHSFNLLAYFPLQFCKDCLSFFICIFPSFLKIFASWRICCHIVLFLQKHISVFYLAISILTLVLLPIFYLIVFLHQRYHFFGHLKFTFGFVARFS